MTVRLIAAASIILFLSMGVSAAHAARTNADISIALIRTVRVSTNSITISYTSSRSATGIVRYTGVDGSAITLTDSVPQVDHLFTIDELDPSRGYTFVLTAESGSHISNQYSILLAPVWIGDPGQSLVPPVDVYAPDGTKISSTLGTSSPSVAPHTPPLWLFALTAASLLVSLFTYRFLQKSKVS